MDNYEIIKKHSLKIGIIDALVFEPKEVCRVVVNFTGMNPNKFDRWSWYYERYKAVDKTLYICLKDDDHLFFLNRESCLDYEEQLVSFVKHYLEKHSVSTSDLYTVGSSMGGYAAIYYAFKLGGEAAIASNPLVNRAAAALHKFTLWSRKIDEVGKHFVRLHDYVSRKKNTFVYVESGEYLADRAASLDLVMSLTRVGNSHCYVQTDHEEHTDTISKEKLFMLLDTVGKIS